MLSSTTATGLGLFMTPDARQIAVPRFWALERTVAAADGERHTWVANEGNASGGPGRADSNDAGRSTSIAAYDARGFYERRIVESAVALRIARIRIEATGPEVCTP